MGALPSHETHERGLYSHRHGRNRRNEIILIPLTTAFFPSPDCPLFQHLYNSRYRRTAKYYFRALRSAQTPRESDYFCTTTAINEEEEFEKFYKEYLEKRELPSGKSAQAQAPPAAAAAGVGYLSAPLLASAAGGPQSTGGAGGGVPSPQSPQDCLNAQGKPPKVGPMDFRSFSDSREGLYQILISDNEAGVFDTDEELRQAYWKQVQQQQTERQRLYQSQQGRRPPAAGSGASAGAPPPPPPPPPQPSLPPPSPSMRPSSTAPVASDAFATRAMAPPSATSGAAAGGGGTANPLSPGAVPPPPPHPSTAAAATTMSMDDLSFDEFVSGYLAAKRYMKGKPVHTRFSKTAAADVKGDPIHPADGAAGSAAVPNEYAASHYKHVTAPCAYDVRPLPCVIASRYDPGKPQPVDDPLYVPFGDSYVKIMGMFGFFPATVGMRRSAMRGTTTNTTAAAAAGSCGAGGHEECEEGSDGRDTQPPRRFPRKEGNSNGDDDVDEDVEIEQHLLKGTMFVDKDVGDQILGNMVMLATYMYVRQCIEARINPQSIPMLPVMMRFPLSNIPMLQFVREFRVRLRSLLEAGTAKAGQKPVHIGMSGFNPEDLAEPHHPQLQKLEEEGYLFEPDVPTASTFNQLFMSAEQAKSTSAPLRRHAGMNTNECGRYPIIMMSGFNVQSTPLRHPALNSTGYPPAVAAAAMVAAASMSHRGSPQSRSMPASPQTNEMPNSTSAGGVGRVPTFPPTAPPPPLPGHGGAAAAAAAAAAASGAGGANAASTTTAAAGMPPLPPPPPAPGALEVGPTTPEEEARKIALLHRRKQRFRIWVEDGHMCIWASAAYARRAALIMSQQLNTTVDSNSVPEQRSWNYRGLLHAGTVVPPPRHVNDVIIVAEDIPRMGLWQGDVLRCCTAAELRVMTESHGTQPLPLPCSTEDAKEKSSAAANHGSGAGDVRTGSQASMTSMAASKTATEPVGVPGSPTNSMSVCEHGSASGAADPNASSGHINFTSNHVSNPLLQEKELAPPTAFWVRGAGGLDDSFTNITETNMPPHPKAEKQLQQAAMQRAKKAAAAVAAAQSSGKKRRGLTAEAAAAAAAQLFVDIDRREGTLNIEEVVLAWIKVVAILTRDSTEEDRAWVRDPQGNPVRVDRYVIRRYEHDGVRFFIGVTPRFVGQQRRIEKVLGEVYALEEREGRRRRQQLGDDNDEDDDGFGGDGGDDHDGHDYHSPHQRHNNSHHANSDGRGFAGSPHLGSLSLVSHQADPISYALGRQSAGNVGAGQYNDVWGAPGAPPTMMAPAALSSAAATPPSEAFRKATPLAGGASPLGSAALPSGGSNGGASGGVGGGAGSTNESSSRLAFAAVFGGGGGSSGGGGKASANAGYVPAKGTANNAELTGPGFEVDDLLERYKSDALFFGDGDDD